MTDDPSDLINQGDRLFDQGNYQAAIGCFTQAADLARRSGQTSAELFALSCLPICWNNLGENNKMVDAATHLLTRAKQADNQKYKMEAGLRLATALANINLPARWTREIRPVLLEGLQTARQLGEEYFEVYHLVKLGECAQQVGEADAAYAWLQDALNALTPSTYDTAFFRYKINLSLSQLARDRGDRAEALHYAEIALGEARKDGNPHFVASAQQHLARIHRWRGEPAEALPLAAEALATSRRLQNEAQIVESLALKTALLSDLGLVEQAQAAYDELWAMEITNADYYKDIGPVAYKTMRDLERAETAYRRYLAGRPTHPDGHCKLALVLFDQGRAAEAVRAWRAALNYRNEFPEALVGLALGLWELGERDEALTIFGQAVDLQPRVAEPEYLAEKFQWSGQAVDAALSLGTRSLKLDNNSVRPQVYAVIADD